MKENIWKCHMDTFKEMDEQRDLMKKYANQLLEDSNGVFQGKIDFGLDTISLWVKCLKNDKIGRFKFFELERITKISAYPAELKITIDNSKSKIVENLEELESTLIEYIQSEKTSTALYVISKLDIK